MPRPLTPPCVRFRTRRFNRISAGTRTCRISYNIRLVRVSRLLWNAVKSDFRLHSSSLSHTPICTHNILECPKSSDYGFLLEAPSIVSRYIPGNDVSAIHPTGSSVFSCLLSQNTPASPGCRLLHSPSPCGHFCPDCGKSAL